MAGEDFRRGDVTLETLDTRVSALEEGYHDLRRQITDTANEVRANTRLTEEIHGEVGTLQESMTAVHGAMFGLGGDDIGVKAKADKVHGVLSDAERGLAFLSRVADTGARWGKPIAYLVAIGTALGIWIKTGSFKWPTF